MSLSKPAELQMPDEDGYCAPCSCIAVKRPGGAGLKLDPTVVDVMVIDRVQKPTDQYWRAILEPTGPLQSKSL